MGYGWQQVRVTTAFTPSVQILPARAGRFCIINCNTESLTWKFGDINGSLGILHRHNAFNPWECHSCNVPSDWIEGELWLSDPLATFRFQSVIEIWDDQCKPPYEECDECLTYRAGVTIASGFPFQVQQILPGNKQRTALIVSHDVSANSILWMFGNTFKDSDNPNTFVNMRNLDNGYIPYYAFGEIVREPIFCRNEINPVMQNSIWELSPQ